MYTVAASMGTPPSLMTVPVITAPCANAAGGAATMANTAASHRQTEGVGERLRLCRAHPRPSADVPHSNACSGTGVP